MRIVEYTNEPQSTACRALWALGVVAGVFSSVLCALMIANNLRLKAVDPVHTPALQRLVQELKTTPQDNTLKEQIRELDYLARRAFFTSQHFNRTATWLLLGGLVVTVLAFKSLDAYHRKLPYPDSHGAKDDLAANARWARQSVTVAGLLLVGLALSLALPWNSPLDRVPAGQTTAPIAPQASARSPLVNRPERSKHWPSFRGAAGGTSTATGLPTSWDGPSGQGIAWKTALPLPGFGSPIVWADRVFVSGANAQTRAVYCVDATDGRMLWEKPVAGIPGSPAEVPKVNEDTGYAAPTMTTDGTRVFAIFATGDLVAFDYNGHLLWAKSFGLPVNPYGHSSSLETFEDTLLVQFDQKKNGFVAALDVRTGAVRWKTERSFGPSWSSPALIDTGERLELILAADPFVTSHDPRTGEPLWQLECLKGADTAPTPVFAHGLLFVAADHVKLMAIDVRTRAVVWECTDEIPGIGTPLAAGDLLIGGLGDGGIVCWAAKTGKRLWIEETDDGFYASPILAENRVYLVDRTGKMFVFEPTGERFKSIGQPILGEEASATPAVYGRSLICRGAKHLFRIGP